MFYCARPLVLKSAERAVTMTELLHQKIRCITSKHLMYCIKTIGLDSTSTLQHTTSLQMHHLSALSIWHIELHHITNLLSVQLRHFFSTTVCLQTKKSTMRRMALIRMLERHGMAWHDMICYDIGWDEMASNSTNYCDVCASGLTSWCPERYV